MLTFSNLERTEKCVSAATLPKIETPNVHATRGRVVHSFLEDRKTLSMIESLARVPEEHRDFCASLPEWIALHGWKPEVAFALNPSKGTARVMHVKNRQYELLDGEIAGTVDAVYFDRQTKRVRIVDYKTGYTELSEPRESLQLLAGAVSASLVSKAESADVSYFYVREDSEPVIKTAELDSIDLDAALERIRLVSERYFANESKIVEGPHCKYCPAFLTCPAKTQLAVSLGSGELTKTLSAQLTAENIPRAIIAIENAQRVIDEVDGQIKKYIKEHGPVTLPDGQLYGEVLYSRETVNRDEAYGILQAQLGELADLCVKRETLISKASIERGLKDKIPKEEIRSILDGMRQCNAIYKHEYTKVERIKK